MLVSTLEEEELLDTELELETDELELSCELEEDELEPSSELEEDEVEELELPSELELFERTLDELEAAPLQSLAMVSCTCGESAMLLESR